MIMVDHKKWPQLTPLQQKQGLCLSYLNWTYNLFWPIKCSKSDGCQFQPLFQVDLCAFSCFHSILVLPHEQAWSGQLDNEWHTPIPSVALTTRQP